MTEYYTAVTGDDGTGDGSIGDPWKTIQHGYNQLVAGDTLNVREGTYVETLVMTTDGTVGNLITIQNYQNEVVTIDGEAGVGGVNNGLPAGSCVQTDPVSGKCMKFEGLVDLKGNYTVFDGIDITRSLGRGLRVVGADNVTVMNNRISYSRASGILGWFDATNLIFDNVEVCYSGDFATYSRGSVPPWPMAIQLRGDGIVFRNGLIYNNWCEGIGAGRNSNDITIEDNVIYDNYALQVYVDHGQNILIQRNLIYFSTDTTFYRGGLPSEGIAVNNESDMTEYYSDNITVINNFVRGCKYNIAIWAQNDLYGVSNMLVAHNTCVEGNEGGMRVSDANTINHSNVIFKNNLVYQTSGTCIAIASPPGVSFKSNLWFNQTPVDSDAQDADDILTDPFLKLTGTLGPGELLASHFEIQGASSAIGTATEDGDSPPEDYFGTTRSDDDIGGHELTTTIPRPFVRISSSARSRIPGLVSDWVEVT